MCVRERAPRERFFVFVLFFFVCEKTEERPPNPPPSLPRPQCPPRPPTHPPYTHPAGPCLGGHVPRVHTRSSPRTLSLPGSSTTAGIHCQLSISTPSPAWRASEGGGREGGGMRGSESTSEWVGQLTARRARPGGRGGGRGRGARGRRVTDRRTWARE